jgi:hypothetical protein
MTVSPQLRAILIASALALTAVALGVYTLSQANKGATNEEPLPPAASLASPQKTLPKPAGTARAASHAGTAKPAAEPKAEAKPVPKPVPNPFVVAAKAGGLPKAVAAQLGSNEVAVVALYTPGLKIDALTQAEARAGAAEAHAGFVAVDVRAQGAALQLTRLLGVLDAPGVLVYRRPAELFVRLDGYSDSKTIAQAAQNADPTPGGVDRSPWARDANTLCAEGAKKIAAVGTPTNPQQRLAFAPRVQTIEQDTRTKLHGLTPARGTRGKVAAMLGAYDAMTPLEAQWLDAMREGDKAGAARIETQTTALGVKGDQIALSLGATSCRTA